MKRCNQASVPFVDTGDLVQYVEALQYAEAGEDDPIFEPGTKLVSVCVESIQLCSDHTIRIFHSHDWREVERVAQILFP